jgi:hypothetical protein
MGYKIRQATRDEVDVMVEWARKEGWNPGLHDAKCFYEQDPKGFFVGLLDNKIIATVSAVRYDNTYGFMGFYIVKKDFRGKGYGMKIFRKAWGYLGNRNKGGDGVLENLKKYSQIGLKLAHLNARYQGFGTGNNRKNPSIVKLQDLDFKKVVNYDTQAFGFNRKKFLRRWINQPKSFSYGYIENGKLIGYGVLRKCFEGYKIGPLFADNSSCASELFNALIGSISKKDKVFFDVPEVNKEALNIIREHKMKKVFATGRIYTKGQPDFPLEKWYGVTSFELG